MRGVDPDGVPNAACGPHTAAPPRGALPMKTADPELMRAINKYHVLNAIRQHGPISRVEIADRTELSRATVSALTAGLLEEDLILIRHVELPSATQRGRPRVMLELNPDAAYVVGVKLAARQISVAVTNFKADVLGTLSIPVRLQRQRAEVIADLVEDGIRQCVSDAGLAVGQISGAGVGVPGMIDAGTGTVLSSPVFGDAPVALGEMLQERLATPVLVECDANLLALAEHWFGHGRGLSSFAVIAVENSIGLGLMLNGELHRGARGVAAQLGHLVIDPDGPACRCGRRGCLDAYASDQGVLERLGRDAAAPEGDGAIAVAAAPTIDQARRRARDGDRRSEAVLREAGAALGVAIANLMTLLNPPKIVLSGSGLAEGDPRRRALLDTLAERLDPATAASTELVFHDWADTAWARGAASLVLQRLYRAPWLAAPA